MASVTRLSIGIRVGPDAIGNAIAARAIGDGLTHHEIVREILSESGKRSISRVVSPVTKGIDTTPSFTTQVQGEFLEGADRWGFAGAVGSVLYLIGAGHLWSLLSLLAAFGLLATCTGIWAFVRWRGHSIYCALFATVLAGLSPSLLNAWHEGGLGQMWVMPATLMLVSPIARLGDSDRLGTALAVGLGVMTILPSYNEDGITFGILLAVAALISIPVLWRRWLSGWWPIAGGAALGALLVLPASLDFLSSLLTTFKENGKAGWPQSYWLSPGEAFGLSNAFGYPLPGPLARSFDNRLVDGIETAVVLVFLIALCYRRVKRPPFILLASPVLVCAAVYVDTRYHTHAINYQYFKTIATLAPIGALAIGLLMVESRSAKHSKVARKFVAKIPNMAVLGLAAVMGIAISVSAGSYITDFRHAGSTIQPSFENLSGSPKAQGVFDRYNIVAGANAPSANLIRSGLNTYALGAEVNLRFIGRFVGAPSTRLGHRIDNPVGVILFEYECPDFLCISKIDKRAIVFQGSGIAVVRLSPSTRALSQLPEWAWYGWVTSRYQELGGVLQGSSTTGGSP